MLALVRYEDRDNTYILYDISIKGKFEIRNQYRLTSEQLIDLLAHNKVANVALENGQIKTNGSVKRYKAGCMVIIVQILMAQAEGEGVQGSYYMTVLNEEIHIMSHKDIIHLYNNGLRIANGKVVNKNGVQTLSSIAGGYATFSKSRGVKNESIQRQRRTELLRQGEEKVGGQSSTYTNGESSIGHIQPAQKVYGGRLDKDYILYELRYKGYQCNVQGEEFLKHIIKAKEANPFGEAVDAHSLEEYNNMTNILFDRGKAGVSVEKDGNIVSVFKHPDSTIKGYMHSAILSAVINGGTKLDCYDINGGLPSMYCVNGFIPVCKIRFNREFAPEGWDYAKSGEPDIVFMAYCGDDVGDLAKKYKEEGYKGYSEYSIPYIEDSDTEDAYTLASKFRDNYISTHIKPEKEQVEQVGQVGLTSKLIRKVLKILHVEDE